MSRASGLQLQIFVLSRPGSSRSPDVRTGKTLEFVFSPLRARSPQSTLRRSIRYTTHECAIRAESDPGPASAVTFVARCRASGAALAHNSRAVDLNHAPATIHALRSPSRVRRHIRQRYVLWSGARRRQVPKTEPAHSNRIRPTLRARFGACLAFRSLLRTEASMQSHPPHFCGTNWNAALAYSRSHLPNASYLSMYSGVG
jgi:hypothetical protein